MASLRKSQLRGCAQAALKKRFFRVEEKCSRGVVPGARLLAYTSAEAEPLEIAVRTSLDREIGLTRHPNGRWATIPKMNEVVVAVPSASDATQAEVLGFDPKVLVKAFDAALAQRAGLNKELSPKAPIFITLDMPRNPKGRGAVSGLIDKANWRELVPICSTQGGGQTESFVDRVKREFAALNGVDVTKVSVEFRILA